MAQIPTPVTPQDAATYLFEYIAAYRDAYQQLTSPFPDGAGYPPSPISPYLVGTLDCFLTYTGAVVLLLSADPPLDCFTDPRFYRASPPLPPEEDRTSLNLMGDSAASPAQTGMLPPVVDGVRMTNDDLSVDLRVVCFDAELHDVVERLTFGCFASARVDPTETPFWMPVILRGLGFSPQWTPGYRYFHYVEMLHHIDSAAWDPRSTRVRVHADVHRDYRDSIDPEAGTLDRKGAHFRVPSESEHAGAFSDLLLRLDEAIHGLERLLLESPAAIEAVFHQYLRQHPELIDLYARDVVSKPRFRYPEPQADTTKVYVEPDFVVVYPERRYKLIELERPGTPIARQSGGGRAETSRAAFQLAEWTLFIARYPDVVQEQFPHLIAGNFATALVVGRDVEGSGDRAASFAASLETIRRQYQATEILTFDGLARRARQAQASLQALNYGVSGQDKSASTVPADDAAE